jgi:hypothetical protein
MRSKGLLRALCSLGIRRPASPGDNRWTETSPLRLSSSGDRGSEVSRVADAHEGLFPGDQDDRWASPPAVSDLGRPFGRGSGLGGGSSLISPSLNTEASVASLSACSQWSIPTGGHPLVNPDLVRADSERGTVDQAGRIYRLQIVMAHLWCLLLRVIPRSLKIVRSRRKPPALAPPVGRSDGSMEHTANRPADGKWQRSGEGHSHTRALRGRRPSRVGPDLDEGVGPGGAPTASRLAQQADIFRRHTNGLQGESLPSCQLSP